MDKTPQAIKFGYFVDVYNLCILVVAKEVNGEKDYSTRKYKLSRSSISAVPKKMKD